MYNGIMKHYKSRQKRDSFKILLKKFKDNFEKLFDLAACKCEFSKCTCDKLLRVPARKRPFLADQRNLRLMCIGSVDVLTTNNLKQRLEWKCKFNSRKSLKTATAQTSTHGTETCAISTSESDEEYIPKKVCCIIGSTSSTPESLTAENRLRLQSLAKIADRYGVSDRAAAARVYHLCWKMLAWYSQPTHPW